MRDIFIREDVQIVHSHGSVSTFAHEALVHASIMGLSTVFTDHSLYGFDTLGSILINKLLKFSTTLVDQLIAVSNITKENMCLRTMFDHSKISVIPNAVVPDDFKPDENLAFLKKSRKPDDPITIIVISRLFPNKGADLLTHLIPKICENNPKVNFIIAGDGPKFIDFQQMIETYRLQEKVQLIGSVQHEKVRDVMCQGDIYLHASLIEAFGTVLVEAASCGLLVVTTVVGGIPEVLPKHMTIFAENTSVSSLVKATTKAIELIRNGYDTTTFHDEIAKIYDWKDVAKRTVKVYDNAVNRSDKPKNWLEIVERFFNNNKDTGNGMMARCLFALCAIVDILFYLFLEWVHPRDRIDKAIKWNHRKK
ncbi:related to Phosphatidylinositol N-acetylglucosaminyltransferase GPI3 subunit [Saccharomycodes ludwigii]|uniref:Related to Phosphatidylinositol N-acetylglucosaminyltransferase GPI3 subunit n=2 Tax=Saccharomycodes ludwigii TaxID=36035 RepID=A0A376B0V6_9ASCO|nr:related to Phosphatidylinositol N-acetylglucosaminyltransferase GPI3 subunit [Saccharomycodes ludwigii]